MQYWFVDGKSVGFRPPTLTEQELIALSKQTGRELKTAPEARELRDVELRLQHMSFGSLSGLAKEALGRGASIMKRCVW